MSKASIKKGGSGYPTDSNKASFPLPPRNTRNLTGKGHEKKLPGKMVVQSPSTDFAKTRHGHTMKLPKANSGQNT